MVQLSSSEWSRMAVLQSPSLSTSPGGKTKPVALRPPCEPVEGGPWRSSMQTHQLQLQVGPSHLLQDGSS